MGHAVSINKIGIRKKRINNFTYPNHYVFKINGKIVLAINGYKCFLCNGKARQVHHIDKSNDNHLPNNLVPLCYKCHRIVHKNNNIDYFSEYKLPPEIRGYVPSEKTHSIRINLSNKEYKKLKIKSELAGVSPKILIQALLQKYLNN